LEIKMRFLFFGVGAIGTYIGGSLALSGQDVIFLERPEVAAAVRSRGLRLNLLGVEHSLKDVTIVNDIADALKTGPFDVAVQAVKSYDTDGLLESLIPFRASLPPVLCLQNGVENELKLAKALGEDKVIPGTVTTAIGRRDAGDILLEKLRGMGLADESGQYDALLTALQNANLKALRFRHASSMKWSKMLTNIIANASSAILQMTPGDIFAHPGLYRLEIEMMRETLQVMAANRIAVTNLPGTPVTALAWAVKNLPLGVSRPILGRQVAGGRGAKMPSFYLDLTSGRGKSEVEYLNGAVVRYGEKAGVATPVNRVLNETLMALTRGELPADSFKQNPEKLLALVG
jgi:2-dehydropantoate 2-reductase